MKRYPAAFGRMYPDIVRAGTLGAVIDPMLAALGSRLRTAATAGWTRADVRAGTRRASIEAQADERRFHVWFVQDDDDPVLLASGQTELLWQAVAAIRFVLEVEDRPVSELIGPFRFLDLERPSIIGEPGADLAGLGSEGDPEDERTGPAVLHLVVEEPEPPLDPELTHRERLVLQRVVEGQTNAQIAIALFITDEEVRALLQVMYRKLGATSPWRGPPPSFA